METSNWHEFSACLQLIVLMQVQKTSMYLFSNPFISIALQYFQSNIKQSTSIENDF